MNERYEPWLTPFAQKLRKNMTPEERHLWYDLLKHLSVTVYRQKPIGEYIVDFYCPQAQLVIEVDGRQHGETQARAEDAERDAFLHSRGLSVVRYSNADIRDNFGGVRHDIIRRIELAIGREVRWVSKE